MKQNLLFLALILFLSGSCINRERKAGIIQYQAEYPVLKYKKFNNVLGLKINISDTQRVTTLKKILISTEGTTKCDDIESAAIYRTAQRGSLINENSELFSETTEISKFIKLSGSVRLEPGDNYLMVSYRLKDNADILGKTGAICVKAVTDRGKAIIKRQDDHKNLRVGVAVRQHNDDGVHTYRIPGLVRTDRGTLLAVYDARRDSRRDLQGDIDIGISRSIDGGNSWGPMIIALDMGEWGGLPQKFNGVSDACLLADITGKKVFVAGLWMHGVINDEGKWIDNLTDTSTAWNHQWRTRGSQPGFDVKQTSQFLLAESSDDGLTWSQPVNLTRMCKLKEWWLWAPAPGSGIKLEDGTLVLPTQGRDRTGEPFSNITYSRDGGVTWETSNPAYTNTTECAVVQLDDGSLMLNMRNNRNRNIQGPGNGRAIAVTHDLGETWVEHQTSRNALIEPVCMASLYRHDYQSKGAKRSVLLFSNPSTMKGRHHITIKASLDNGVTWPEKYWLLLDEGSGNGYSCLTGVDNDNIGILYEGSQADLVFQKIPLKEIIGDLNQ